MSPAYQPLERRALKHGGNKLAPVVLRCRSKAAGERQGFGSGHSLKLPWVARTANTGVAGSADRPRRAIAVPRTGPRHGRITSRMLVCAVTMRSRETADAHDLMPRQFRSF